ncbi:MAG: NAD(P)H-binding protein [Saprospiraceae bacterium]
MSKVIITGSTGMVGRGVLLECLDSARIEEVLVINRSSLEMQHPKLKELLLTDFMQIDTVKDQLKGYDACFYCMGISAVGMSEADYTRITYTTTETFVNVLYELNPNMVFVYVSGMGTDSSEKGRQMWARVKGRTENTVFSKGFKAAYAFRPGIIIPERGIQSKTAWYNTMYAITRPLFPLFKRSKSVTTTTRLGQAMINTLSGVGSKKILENPDINELSAQG